MKQIILSAMFLMLSTLGFTAPFIYQKDVIETSAGQLSIYFIGHGSLMFDFNGKIIYVDPCSQFGNYKILPKADIILITHHHSDHFDIATISLISKNETQIILTQTTLDSLKKGIVMKNGDIKKIDNIEITAVPAYNTTPGREKFHPRGRDNGYIINLGGKRIYIAGDTENTPEMESLRNIDIAFLPMNQPYTMLPAQVASAVRRFKPKILYPYHTGETDLMAITKLLADLKEVDVRVRNMK